MSSRSSWVTSLRVRSSWVLSGPGLSCRSGPVELGQVQSPRVRSRLGQSVEPSRVQSCFVQSCRVRFCPVGPAMSGRAMSGHVGSVLSGRVRSRPVMSRRVKSVESILTPGVEPAFHSGIHCRPKQHCLCATILLYGCLGHPTANYRCRHRHRDRRLAQHGHSTGSHRGTHGPPP